MLENNVLLALIALGSVCVSGTIAPIAVAVVQYRIGRAERRENNQRQDEIAAKADTVANKAAEAANLLLAANERVAATTKTTNQKIDAIHTLGESTHLLVNSKMTAVLRSLRAALRQIVSLKTDRGDTPDLDSINEIDELDRRIAEMDRIVKKAEE